MRDKAKPAGRQGRKVTGLLDSRAAFLTRQPGYLCYGYNEDKEWRCERNTVFSRY